MRDRYRYDRHLTLTATLVDGVIRRGEASPSEAAGDIPGLDPSVAARLLWVAAKRPHVYPVRRVGRGRYAAVGLN